MKITLIGLGKMGTTLAKRLLLSRFELTVFNRTKEKMQPLIQLGAKPAKSLQDAVKDAEIVVTCLLDDNAVLQTTQEFLDFMPQDAIHIGTSTILPETSKKLLEIHNNQGSIYIAGNVLGVPKAAEKGALTTIVAGNADAVKKCKSVFQAYSSNIIEISDFPYQANVVKICMNYLLVSAIEVMGEIYTFAEKNEVNLDLINKLFHTVFSHPAFKLYVDKIKDRTFDEVNFDIKGGYKDLNLFQQAFSQVGVVPNISNIIKDKFIIAIAHHLGDRDWSAITDITRNQANI